ncbi:unnamed protein product, partial [marine sediment metagenome]
GPNSVLDGLTIKNAYAVAGGAIQCYSSSPKITNCVLVNNVALEEGGAISCHNSDVTIANCVIRSNSAIGGGIGPMGVSIGGVTQSWRRGGGGISCIDSNPSITNCVISDNEAQGDEFSDSGAGGGIWCDNSSPLIANCTFVNNTAFEGGSIYCCFGSNPAVTNCILWDGTPEEIYVFDGSPVVTYCNVQGGFPGTGNINSDPCFADTSSSDPNKWDYHLQSQAGRWDPNVSEWVTDANTSLCIDAGDPNSDWTAELWPHGKRINMGAYGGTSQASMSLSDAGNIADLNNSNSVGYTDLMLLANKWLYQEVLLRENLDRNGFV